MDRISYKCANEINDDLAWFALYVCGKKLKVWRYPVSESGGHYCDPYIDYQNYDDNPDDDYDDTIIAPNWDDLRKILNKLEPGIAILVDFEAIEDIDEFAYKLRDYYNEVFESKRKDILLKV